MIWAVEGGKMLEMETDVRHEVAGLRERLERLERVLGSAVQGEEVGVGEPRCLPETADSEALHRAFEATLRRMGITLREPVLTPEQVRDEFARCGVRPEERLGNTILARLRGYEE